MLNIVIGIAVLMWILYRQLTERPLKERSPVGWILLIIGIIELAQFLPTHNLGGTDGMLLIASALIGCALAAARAFTVRIWSSSDGVRRQGNVITAILWLIGIGQHIVLGALAGPPGLAETTVLAYLGLVLLVQRAVLMARARSYGHYPTR